MPERPEWARPEVTRTRFLMCRTDAGDEWIAAKMADGVRVTGNDIDWDELLIPTDAIVDATQTIIGHLVATGAGARGAAGFSDAEVAAAAEASAEGKGGREDRAVQSVVVGDARVLVVQGQIFNVSEAFFLLAALVA